MSHNQNLVSFRGLPNQCREFEQQPHLCMLGTFPSYPSCARVLIVAPLFWLSQNHFCVDHPQHPQNGSLDHGTILRKQTAQSGCNGCKDIWPWVKSQIVPPVNIPIPTKIEPKMGKAPTPNCTIEFDNHSQLRNIRPFPGIPRSCRFPCDSLVAEISMELIKSLAFCLPGCKGHGHVAAKEK